VVALLATGMTVREIAEPANRRCPHEAAHQPGGEGGRGGAGRGRIAQQWCLSPSSAHCRSPPRALPPARFPLAPTLLRLPLREWRRRLGTNATRGLGQLGWTDGRKVRIVGIMPGDEMGTKRSCTMRGGAHPPPPTGRKRWQRCVEMRCARLSRRSS
jgi:hypothetical protein